ncbi:MAG: DNA alkylation repair protein, partial [Clostridiaceae bacterium]|nr:DNA alkylation repair protein [Clostridiaceae bacterium]
LRKLAKEIAKGDWRLFLSEYGLNPASVADGSVTDRNVIKDKDGGKVYEYFEEIMLQGMVIGAAKADIEEILDYVAAFVPKIDNWSVCDSFCISLKKVNHHKERVWSFLQGYLHSVREFEIRFGVVMLLCYYIDEKYIKDVLSILNKIRHDGYYAKMAVAWAISECFVKQQEQTMNFLQNNNLDDFTYNKALQKIAELDRVDQRTKETIRSMKRK